MEWRDRHLSAVLPELADNSVFTFDIHPVLEPATLVGGVVAIGLLARAPSRRRKQA